MAVITHRIAAGIIVVAPDRRVALVRHQKPGVYDFWVAPGGGINPGEDLREAARREAFEEAGLVVEPQKLIAIEQLVGAISGTHQVKHWFVSRLSSAPPLRVDHPLATAELITDARWLSRSDLAGKTVYPLLLLDVFWDELAAGFPNLTILPVRTMDVE